jgi:hypothetical protein
MKKSIMAFFLMACLSASAQNKVTVLIHSKTGYEGSELFADETAKKLEAALNSEKFKAKIIEGNFTETNGLTNQQIYEKILFAHEVVGAGGTDAVVDLRVRTMNRQTDGKKWMRWCKIGSSMKTIGKDGGNSGVVATCPQWLEFWRNSNMLSDLAGHYAHEYMHLLGFSHFGKKSTSLVYQVGNIISAIIKEGI